MIKYNWKFCKGKSGIDSLNIYKKRILIVSLEPLILLYNNNIIIVLSWYDGIVINNLSFMLIVNIMRYNIIILLYDCNMKRRNRECVDTSQRKELIYYRLKGWRKIHTRASSEYLFEVFHGKGNVYRIGSKKKQAIRLQSDCINRQDFDNVQYICWWMIANILDLYVYYEIMPLRCAELIAYFFPLISRCKGWVFF